MIRINGFVELTEELKSEYAAEAAVQQQETKRKYADSLLQLMSLHEEEEARRVRRREDREFQDAISLDSQRELIAAGPQGPTVTITPDADSSYMTHPKQWSAKLRLYGQLMDDMGTEDFHCDLDMSQRRNGIHAAICNGQECTLYLWYMDGQRGLVVSNSDIAAKDHAEHNFVRSLMWY